MAYRNKRTSAKVSRHVQADFSWCWWMMFLARPTVVIAVSVFNSNESILVMVKGSVFYVLICFNSLCRSTILFKVALLPLLEQFKCTAFDAITLSLDGDDQNAYTYYDILQVSYVLHTKVGQLLCLCKLNYARH